MRISDWSSDVCSSDLGGGVVAGCFGRQDARQGATDRNAVGAAGDRVGTQRGRVTAAGLGREAQCGVTATGGLGAVTESRITKTGGDAEIGRASWRERVCKYV